MSINDEELNSCYWSIEANEIPISEQLQSRIATVKNLIANGATPEKALERVFGQNISSEVLDLVSSQLGKDII